MEFSRTSGVVKGTSFRDTGPTIDLWRSSNGAIADVDSHDHLGHAVAQEPFMPQLPAEKVIRPQTILQLLSPTNPSDRRSQTTIFEPLGTPSQDGYRGAGDCTDLSPT